MRETGEDQTVEREKADSERPQPFLPVPSVVAKDRLDIIFINRKKVFAEPIGVISSLVVQADALLVSKGYLGIGDNGGQKECMGRCALGTPEPADAKADSSILSFYRTAVVPVNREAGGMSAGVSQLMELEIIYNGIIKGLRNL